MSYNGSGTFQINTSGQPVVTGTVISSTAFNSLTADLATGLSTAITKDGQTTTTVRIPFAAGINSSLATDSSSTTTGSIITAGGVGIAKALNVGTTLAVAGNSTFTGFVNAPNTFGFKNRIINGAMVIDQRNAGASVTPTASAYTLDRWQANLSVTSKYSVQQQTSVVPAGFSSAMKIASLSAYSVGAGESFAMAQSIEGYNIADLGWGTANAQAVILSFRVYSSLTGTFGGSLINASANRSYPFTYSIPAANTWTTISITVAGDTSGTWGTTNGAGIGLYFGLGVGSTFSGIAGSWAGSLYFSATGATSVVGTSGATFYITGVQLEKGSTATSFDYRPYGTELMLCQRYYSVATTTTRFGSYSGVQYLRTTISTPASMRASPTVTKLTNGTLLNTVAGNITYTSLSPTQFGFEVASSTTGDTYAIGGTGSLESEL